jgi:uncharacterized protein with PQ loop repeat
MIVRGVGGDTMTATIAGSISTCIFAISVLPMLIKAVRTKDLESYSFPQVLLSNVGNIVHSIYVFSLPAGPIWVLHTFYMVSAALMLVWYLRYAPAAGGARVGQRPRAGHGK